VVILSLFFWGFVWGPTGMLLSVPMTVVIKLLLEVTPGANRISVLLGTARDAEVASRRLEELPSQAVVPTKAP
jgi:AI-2 transport protein TqsA